MKNILFIHSSSEMYGSDKSLLYLLKNIKKDEYRVNVLLPEEGPLVEKLNEIEGVSVDIYKVSVLRRKNLSIYGAYTYINEFSKSYKFIKKYIKNNNIDIVYTNTAVVFPGAIAAKHSGIKSVWHIREIIKSNLERKIISKIVNRYADIIIANSKSTGLSICKNKNKLRIVYNAVENKVAKFKSDKSIVVGMAGRINRWKGQKLFVDAAEVINKKYPDVKFKIAGSAYNGEEWIENDLKKYISEKKLDEAIEMMGLVTDMDLFYNSIDIFVLPSIQPEPFGLVVVEAMEMKKAVVATRHGGPMEIIDDGINGYLVDFKNCNEMAERCIELIENNSLRIRIAEEGYVKKRKCFSLEKTVKDIEEILSKI